MIGRRAGMSAEAGAYGLRHAYDKGAPKAESPGRIPQGARGVYEHLALPGVLCAGHSGSVSLFLPPLPMSEKMVAVLDDIGWWILRRSINAGRAKAFARYTRKVTP